MKPRLRTSRGRGGLRNYHNWVSFRQEFDRLGLRDVDAAAFGLPIASSSSGAGTNAPPASVPPAETKAQTP